MSALVIPNGNRLQAGKSGDLWGKYPWWRAPFDPTYGVYFGDDFDPYLAERYTSTDLNSATGSTTLNESAYGSIRLDPGASTTEHGRQVKFGETTGAWIAPVAGRTILFETLINLETVSTPPHLFVGFSTINTAVLGSSSTITSSAGATNAIGFYIDTTLTLKLVSKNNTEFTAIDSVGTAVSSEIIKLGFEIDGVSKITPVVNGVRNPAKAMSTAASIPDGDLMTPVWAICSQGTVRPTMDVLNWAYWMSGQGDVVGT